MSKWERRYFAVLGVVGTLSLVTIGATVPPERFVDPAEEAYQYLLTSLDTAPASSEPEPEPQAPVLEVDDDLWLPGAAPLPCVAALDSAETSSRLVPPLELDEAALGCRPRFD